MDNFENNIFCQVQEGMDDSIAMLERLLQANRAITIPTIHCFGMLNENVNIVSHDWHRGTPVSVKEIRCQVHTILHTIHMSIANAPPNLHCRF